MCHGSSRREPYPIIENQCKFSRKMLIIIIEAHRFGKAESSTIIIRLIYYYNIISRASDIIVSIMLQR